MRAIAFPKTAGKTLGHPFLHQGNLESGRWKVQMQTARLRRGPSPGTGRCSALGD